jgi:putative transposase
MKKEEKQKRKSHFHAVYDLKYHLVLVTKYRRKVITQEILDRLKEIFTEQCHSWSVSILEFGGEADHVHLLLQAHPAMDLSKFLNSIKTVSSRLIRKEFSEHIGKFYWKPYFWTRAYCLLSVGGAPLEILKKYVQSQERPEK